MNWKEYFKLYEKIFAKKSLILFFLLWFIFLTENSIAAENNMHYVKNNRIFDEQVDKEVIWRGAGGSYLFHAEDYITAWENHLPEIQKMGLNTVRLAFRFSNSSPGADGYTGADTMDYDKLDEILNWLDEHGIKAILDLHNYLDMYGDFGSQNLIINWVDLATRYKNDSRIVAYELFNEPYRPTRNTSIQTGEDVAKFYANLTQEIRKVDPNHIHIWQAAPSYYFYNSLDEFVDYLQPNVVYTMHEWWTNREREFDVWTIEGISCKEMSYLVGIRKKLNVPIWLGEFGLGGGGNQKYNSSDPHDQIAEQLLFRCEEQAIGWNLWQGSTSINKPWYSQGMFPLQIYNENLFREPWHCSIPKLTDYIINKNLRDTDYFYSYAPWEIRMWYNKDYVEFKPGIVIYVIVNSTNKTDNTSKIYKKLLEITEPTNITNIEGGGIDNNTWIYSISENKVHVYGIMVDKNNQTMEANISTYNQGTSQLNESTSATNFTGSYSLSIWPGIYDLEYNVSYIPNFFIKILSVNVLSNLKNFVNYINKTSNGVSFTIDIAENQEIQTYSSSMPSRILKNGIVIQNVSSYSQLANDTWFYNTSENKLYILFNQTS